MEFCSKYQRKLAFFGKFSSAKRIVTKIPEMEEENGRNLTEAERKAGQRQRESAQERQIRLQANTKRIAEKKLRKSENAVLSRILKGKLVEECEEQKSNII
ncbi:hypothetical protein AVEN_47157-1 [Araneus ventricosus]|uniref:Uncharacterized protein n=1 Tax=Araneus ventricosus TaxID=182803 RepID=A0A4Y2MA26_ARAVE|nr:hypothetical protein AVEN_47157-1 [Araneus ventricosus]